MRQRRREFIYSLRLPIRFAFIWFLMLLPQLINILYYLYNIFFFVVYSILSQYTVNNTRVIKIYSCKRESGRDLFSIKNAAALITVIIIWTQLSFGFSGILFFVSVTVVKQLIFISCLLKRIFVA